MWASWYQNYLKIWLTHITHIRFYEVRLSWEVADLFIGGGELLHRHRGLPYYLVMEVILDPPTSSSLPLVKWKLDWPSSFKVLLFVICIFGWCTNTSPTTFRLPFTEVWIMRRRMLIHSYPSVGTKSASTKCTNVLSKWWESFAALARGLTRMASGIIVSLLIERLSGGQEWLSPVRNPIKRGFFSPLALGLSFAFRHWKSVVCLDDDAPRKNMSGEPLRANSVYFPLFNPRGLSTFVGGFWTPEMIIIIALVALALSMLINCFCCAKWIIRRPHKSKSPSPSPSLW